MPAEDGAEPGSMPLGAAFTDTVKSFIARDVPLENLIPYAASEDLTEAEAQAANRTIAHFLRNEADRLWAEGDKYEATANRMIGLVPTEDPKYTTSERETALVHRMQAAIDMLMKMVKGKGESVEQDTAIVNVICALEGNNVMWSVNEKSA